MKSPVLSISAFLLFIMIACEEGNKEAPALTARELIANPATASNESGVDPEAKVPVMEFESTIHDFGTIVEGEKVSHVFKFKNTGKVPLVIQNASASCGCTVPEWPKEAIAPGGSGQIRVEFDSKGKSGAQNKAISVLANTQPSNTTLEIKTVVNPLSSNK